MDRNYGTFDSIDMSDVWCLIFWVANTPCVSLGHVWFILQTALVFKMFLKNVCNNTFCHFILSQHSSRSGWAGYLFLRDLTEPSRSDTLTNEQITGTLRIYISAVPYSRNRHMTIVTTNPRWFDDYDDYDKLIMTVLVRRKYVLSYTVINYARPHITYTIYFCFFFGTLSDTN